MKQLLPFKVNLSTWWRQHQSWILLLSLFAFYLLLIPRIVTALTPCLDPLSIQSYDQEKCNGVLAMDRFVSLALGGLLVTLIVGYIAIKPTLKQFVSASLGLTALVILAYYIYLMPAQQSVDAAAIFI